MVPKEKNKSHWRLGRIVDCCFNNVQKKDLEGDKRRAPVLQELRLALASPAHSEAEADFSDGSAAPGFLCFVKSRDLAGGERKHTAQHSGHVHLLSDSRVD